MHADNGIKPNNKKQQLQPLAISKQIKQLLKKTETRLVFFKTFTMKEPLSFSPSRRASAFIGGYHAVV
jgi:hypothetical protein